MLDDDIAPALAVDGSSEHFGGLEGGADDGSGWWSAVGWIGDEGGLLLGERTDSRGNPENWKEWFIHSGFLSCWLSAVNNKDICLIRDFLVFDTDRIVIRQSDIEEFVKEVAGRIRIRRNELGLSKLAVAQRAGLDPRAITFVEENRRVPSIATVCRIAIALECEPKQFFPDTLEREK